jgi:hypothetical protein
VLLGTLGLQLLEPLFELGGLAIEPGHFVRQRGGPRSVRRAWAAFASATRWLICSAASRASKRRRWAVFSRSSAARCSTSSCAMEALASACRSSSWVPSSRARRRSRASSSARRASRLASSAARQLRLVADDGLLVPVDVARAGLDGGARVGDGRARARPPARRPYGRVPFGGHPLAQFPDFALRGQDAARLGGRPAEHEVGAIDHVPVHGGDERTGACGCLHGLVEGFRDPRLAERARDHRGMRT